MEMVAPTYARYGFQFWETFFSQQLNAFWTRLTLRDASKSPLKILFNKEE